MNAFDRILSVRCFLSQNLKLVEQKNYYTYCRCGEAYKKTGGLKRHVKVHEVEPDALFSLEMGKKVPRESRAPKSGDDAGTPVKKAKVWNLLFERNSSFFFSCKFEFSFSLFARVFAGKNLP